MANKDRRRASAVVDVWHDGGPENDDEDIRNVHDGLQAVQVFAQDLGGDTIWMIQNGLDDLDSYAIRDGLGEGVARALRARRQVPLGDQTLRFETPQTMRRNTFGGAVFTVWPTAETLNFIDDQRRPTSVVVIPYVGEAQDWIDAWGPVSLRTGEAVAEPLTIENDDVRAAVDNFIHFLSSVSHPNDLARIRKTFVPLRRRKGGVNTREIRAYLRRESNWKTPQIDQFVKLAGGRSQSS